MKQKVLVTYQMPKEGLVELTEHFDVIYPDEMAMPKERILELIPECVAVMAIAVGVGEKTLNAAKQLKIISVYGAGYNQIDIPLATAKGIVVSYTPDAVTEATAELAFGLLLDVARRISELDRRMRQDQNTFKWGMMRNLGQVLYGKTLGIIGMGRIGRAVARRALAFGMKICYYNRNRLTSTLEEEVGATYLSLDEVLAQSDFVSLNTPLTQETRHLIGERELQLMKRSAYLVNTARGAVVDEKALVKALQTGVIAGAGLDVFENEPRVSEELFLMDNVVLVPHIGTEALEPRIEITKAEAGNIIEYLVNGKPINVVNPEVLKK